MYNLLVHDVAENGGVDGVIPQNDHVYDEIDHAERHNLTYRSQSTRRIYPMFDEEGSPRTVVRGP